MNVSFKRFAFSVIIVSAAVMIAGCPLPYEFAGGGGGAAHSTDPTTPDMTAPVMVSYSVQGGASGTLADGGSFFAGQTTTVTISTATLGAVIFYTTDGTTLADLRTAQKFTGSHGTLTVSRADTPQSMSIHAVAVGPNMLPSPVVAFTVGVSPYPILSVTVDKASVTEDGGIATFTITSSIAPTGDLTVSLKTGGGYSTSYETGLAVGPNNPLTVTLAHDTTSTSITVRGIHDPSAASPLVTLTLQADPAYTVGASSSASFALQDDNSFVVTYDPNSSSSGTAPTDGTFYAPGATVTVLGNSGSLARTGYAFSGWATQADGNGTRYNQGVTFAITANTTLYARWVATCTVTYNGNGGIGQVPVDPASYTPGQVAKTLANTGDLFLSGSVFAGWTTNPNPSGASASYAAGANLTMGSSDVTLYAVWIPVELDFTSSGTTIAVSESATPPTGAWAVPPGVTSISGFWNCNSLTSVSIPSSVTFIPDDPFGYCSQLASISVDPTNPNYVSVSGVLFDKSMKRLMQAPERLTGGYIIPSSVTTIAGGAFQNCNSLTNVTIPTGVNSIGGWAFAYTGLSGSVTIPSTVGSIGTWAFAGCSALTAISVSASNSYYASVSGVLFDKAVATLVQAPAGMTGNYNIPPTVTTILDGSFQGCSGLTGITIPPSVTSIRNQVFLGNSSLTSIIIPGSVTSIGSVAFEGCGNLSNVFMQSVTPPSLPAGSNAFFSVGPNFLIHVPSVAAVGDYKAAQGWSDYANNIVTP